MNNNACAVVRQTQINEWSSRLLESNNRLLESQKELEQLLRPILKDEDPSPDKDVAPEITLVPLAERLRDFCRMTDKATAINHQILRNLEL